MLTKPGTNIRNLDDNPTMVALKKVFLLKLTSLSTILFYSYVLYIMSPTASKRTTEFIQFALNHAEDAIRTALYMSNRYLQCFINNILLLCLYISFYISLNRSLQKLSRTSPKRTTIFIF